MLQVCKRFQDIALYVLRKRVKILSVVVPIEPDGVGMFEVSILKMSQFLPWCQSSLVSNLHSKINLQYLVCTKNCLDCLKNGSFETWVRPLAIIENGKLFFSYI